MSCARQKCLTPQRVERGPAAMSLARCSPRHYNRPRVLVESFLTNDHPAFIAPAVAAWASALLHLAGPEEPHRLDADSDLRAGRRDVSRARGISAVRDRVC